MDEGQVEVAGAGARLYKLQFSDVLLVVLLVFILMVWLPKHLRAHAQRRRVAEAAKLKRKD